MTKYQEFLNGINVIPEDLFYEVLDSLPEYDSDKIDFLNIYDYTSQDEIAAEIIATILYNWPSVTCECVNFEKKTFDLVDVESLKDLREINATFSKWTITNYDEYKEILLGEETNKEKDVFIHNYDFSNVPLEDLKKFLEKYEN
jgi:hypothetical protein